jgi:hypothetical protein
MDIYPKECKPGYTCTLMLIAALFAIAKVWKHTRCPTTDAWTMKLLYIYTMESYSAKRSNDLWFECKWMQVDIMVRKVNQAQKHKGGTFSLIWGR